VQVVGGKITLTQDHILLNLLYQLILPIITSATSTIDKLLCASPHEVKAGAGFIVPGTP
jgi:hypothetical protein